MKLEDINQTTFASLSPEIQAQLIDAQNIDPIIMVALIIIFAIPIITLR